MKNRIKPFIIPTILMLAAVIVTWKWEGIQPQLTEGVELNAFMTILPILPYILLIITFSLGFRSNRTDLIFISLILMFSYYALNTQHDTAKIHKYIYFLLPLNFAIFCHIQKKSLFTRSGLSLLIILLLQIGFFSFIVHFTPERSLQYTLDFQEAFPRAAAKITTMNIGIFDFFSENKIFFLNIPLFLIYLISVSVIYIRFHRTGNILLPAYIIALSSTLIAMMFAKPDPAYMVFFSAAGLMLLINAFEKSLNMAYIDELTNLPGRRSLEETLHNLGKRFAIAMIDIDHFKKFNDTYGHKIGDEVLKMVAAKLEKLSGGVKTFRYGGEEFTAVFPHKTAEEAKPFMEAYRFSIENSEFVIRGKERKKGSEKQRGKISSGKQKKVKVTVSIGIAASIKDERDPHKILKLADQALYKAKKTGRNKVCLKK